MSDGAGLTCEEQFIVCKAAADTWLQNANAPTYRLPPIIGAAQRATHQVIYDSMILGCQLAEVACITGRVGAKIAKPLAPVIEGVVYVLGAIVIIAGIAYLVASVAPLVLVPILAL